MSAKDIRNIVLLGHGGSGKTTLAESMLFMTGGTDRFGKVTDGNTTCDYDAEEIKRNISISLAVAPVKYKNVKINVLDTPGNFDFAGEVLSGIRAAECAVLVCGAKDGLSVGAERAWKMLGNKPRMIFINRTDEENSDYNACFDALKGKFGTAVAPIVAPIIDGSKKVTGIVDLLHNKAYEVKGGKAAEPDIGIILRKLCQQKGVEIIEAKACPDHIHMLVSIPPKYGVSQIMGYLKGKSSLMIFDRHANLKYKYGNRHFWARGYYIDTVGRNKKQIAEYIRNQLESDQLADQLGLKEFVDPFTGRQNK